MRLGAGIARGWCLAAIFVSVGLPPRGSASAEAAEDDLRIALIIGNGAYRHSPLTNPVNDAQAMAGTLSSVGFRVTKLENASKAQMSDAIRSFGDAIEHGGVGLFYFAGHGVQVNGENYLLPVDAKSDDMSRVVEEGVAAAQVLREMSHAKNKVNLVILDACRTNSSSRSAPRGIGMTPVSDGGTRADRADGLAPMEALVGTVIAYATAPGSVAADGTGKNGVYTEQLLGNLTEPGLKVEEVFKRTRFAVRQETGGRQVPWENTSLEGDFYFVPARAGTPTAGGAGPSSNLAAEQHATLETGQLEGGTQSVRGTSGFSFSREEERDQAALVARADETQTRLRTPCPESLRRRPIAIDISEESRADGLVLTQRSARFAELVNLHLQHAGLTTRVARTHEGSYSIQGVVFSQQGENLVARLNEASVSAEIALRDPGGRIVTMVDVSGATFTGQDTSASARALAKEQASDVSSQLYAAFCAAGTDRPGR